MARLHLRTLEVADVPEVQALSDRIFGSAGMKQWRAGQLEAHVKRFPDGQFVVLLDDRLVASASTLLVSRERVFAPHTWLSITGGGDIPNHDPAGDWLYGIEIQVDRSARGLGVAALLYRARKVVARAMGLAGVAVAGRMPGYAAAVQAEPDLAPETYIEDVRGGDRVDPVLGAQLAAGLRAVRVMPDYTEDQASLDNAVLLVWETAPDIEG